MSNTVRKSSIGKISNINDELKVSLSYLDKIALYIANIIGSFNFVVFCIVLVTIPIVWKDSLPYVQYISSGYLQLVLLPLILISQNIEDRRSTLREEKEFMLTIKNEESVKEIIVLLDVIIRKLEVLEKGKKDESI